MLSAAFLLAGALCCPPPDPPPAGPPVSPLDVHRFPPDPVIEQARAAGCRYREALRGRLACSARPGPALAAALAESERADLAWATLFMVRPGPVCWDEPAAGGYPPALERLRDLIGAEAYARGEMPAVAAPLSFTPAD